MGFSLRVLFVLRRPNPLSKRILLAHVRAFLGVPVIFVSTEMVDPRIEIGPHHDVPWAVRLRQPFIGELICTGGSCYRSRSGLFRRRCRCAGVRRRGCGFSCGRPSRGGCRVCCRSSCWRCGSRAALVDIGLFGDPLGLVGRLVSLPAIRLGTLSPSFVGLPQEMSRSGAPPLPHTVR